MIIRDVMTPNPITLQDTDSINTLIGLMRDRKLKKVPVLHGDKLVGIVTDKDLGKVSPSDATTLSVFELNYVLSQTKIKDAMTKNVFTCTPDTFVEDAAVVMRDNRINALCIVENDKLVGIVTESDLFDSLIEMLGGRFHGNRFVIEVDNVPGTLGKLGAAMEERGINMSHFALVSASNEKAQLLIRTGLDSSLESAKTALENCGFKVISASLK